MAGRANEAVTRKVDEALRLLNERPELSVAKAAREVGLSRTTLRDRLNGRVKAGVAPIGEDGEHPLDTTLDGGEIPVFTLDYSHLPVLYTYPFGDLHKGSPNYAAGKVRSWINYLVSREQTSMMGTGDWLNAALRTSVSDVYEETTPVGRAKRELRAELEPLAEANRIDIAIPGNHEARIHKAVGDCPVEDIADALGVNYSRTSCFLRYIVGDQEYVVYLRHGSGSGRASAQAGRMEREGQIAVADVYVSGHTHRQQVIRGAVFELGADGVAHRRRQVYITSGSFLSYEDYAASLGLPPADIGAPRIRFDGRRKRVFASL